MFIFLSSASGSSTGLSASAVCSPVSICQGRSDCRCLVLTASVRVRPPFFFLRQPVSGTFIHISPAASMPIVLLFHQPRRTARPSAVHPGSWLREGLSCRPCVLPCVRRIGNRTDDRRKCVPGAAAYIRRVSHSSKSTTAIHSTRLSRRRAFMRRLCRSA